MRVAENEARDDYHDPTAGIGGAPPARSALTLRLVLAGWGFLICALAAAAFLTVVSTPAPQRWLHFWPLPPPWTSWW